MNWGVDIFGWSLCLLHDIFENVYNKNNKNIELLLHYPPTQWWHSSCYVGAFTGVLYASVWSIYCSFLSLLHGPHREGWHALPQCQHHQFLWGVGGHTALAAPSFSCTWVWASLKAENALPSLRRNPSFCSCLVQFKRSEHLLNFFPGPALIALKKIQIWFL